MEAPIFLLVSYICVYIFSTSLSLFLSLYLSILLGILSGLVRLGRRRLPTPVATFSPVLVAHFLALSSPCPRVSWSKFAGTVLDSWVLGGSARGCARRLRTKQIGRSGAGCTAASPTCFLARIPDLGVRINKRGKRSFTGGRLDQTITHSLSPKSPAVASSIHPPKGLIV
jgi:hypothetical protein